MLVFLFITSFVIGTLSGMLGIGGGIIFAPVLLYVPEWLGFAGMSMKSISGLTMVQGLVGAASGYLVHRRYRVINPALIYLMGPAIVISSFSGAHLSSVLNDALLKAVFALMAVTAAILMQIKKQDISVTSPVEEIHFNKPLAVLIAALIGFLGGLVGQGGSFLLVPALINILNLPTKVAMGSNLGIVLLSSLAGFGGKVSAGLVEPSNALAIMAGVIPGAQLGGYFSHQMKSVILKRILSLLIVLVSIQIWWSLLEPKIVSVINSLPPNLVPLYGIALVAMLFGIVNACLLIWLARTLPADQKQRQKESP